MFYKIKMGNSKSKVQVSNKIYKNLENINIYEPNLKDVLDNLKKNINKNDYDIEISVYEEKLKQEFEKLEKDKTISRVDKLEKQVDLLKNINIIMEERQYEIKFEINKIKEINDSIEKNTVELSNIKIEEYIDSLLSNENVNVKYVPDIAERQIYINIFSLFINILDETLKTASVKCLGHEIKFDLKPIIDQ